MQKAASDLPMSEDCLFLNISTPAAARPGTALPVLVWVHGGGFVSGSGRNTLSAAYNSRDVIIVSVNYRLGPMGFFTHRLLDEEAGEPLPANPGLLDIQSALFWVRDNIAAFGGDPDKVVIGGVSAGAQAVILLLTDPLTGTLVRGAIIQSGYALWPMPERDAADAAEDGYRISDRLARHASGGREPDGADDLRALPASGFIDGVSGFFRPVIDGVWLRSDAPDLFRQGLVANVPILTGAASFDGSVMPASAIAPGDLWALLGKTGSRVRSTYAADFDVSEARGVQRVFGDFRYLLSALFLARRNAGMGIRAWMYYLDYPALSHNAGLPPGAPHGSEIALMARAGDVSEEGPGGAMLAYWASFIHRLDPNSPGMPYWPEFSPAANSHMVFRETPVPGAGLPDDRIAALQAAFDGAE